MFTILAQPLDSSQTVRYQLLQNQSILSWQQVIMYWGRNPEFQLFYSKTLADSSFPAFFWEHPPINQESLTMPYAFVLVESRTLARIAAYPNAFESYFRKEELVINFANLGGDAQLVVPCPQAGLSTAHLANFVRSADQQTNVALWQCLADVLSSHVKDEPVWLSTSGLGVYWLHLRLDSRPKYYTHRPYRVFDY